MYRILKILTFCIVAASCTDPEAAMPLVPSDSTMLVVPADTIDTVALPIPQAETLAESTEQVVQEGEQTIQEIEEGPEDAQQVREILRILSFGKIVTALIIFIISFLLIRFFSKILERLAERSVQYRITIKSLIPIIRIFGWLLAITLIIGGVFHPPIATVIAISASAAIAVGFAAQDILKNMFGGVMILFDRPFQVGDKIQVGDFYGEVVEIGLRSTRIVTPGDSLVSVPNSEIMVQPVSNANNGEANCQVQADIFLPITADTQRIRQVAIEAAQVSRFIYLNKPIVVLFNNIMTEERSLIKMSIKAYVADIRNEMAFKSDMTEITMRELLNQHLIDPEDMK
jgi:small-conductance mechanosensitive channel